MFSALSLVLFICIAGFLDVSHGTVIATCSSEQVAKIKACADLIFPELRKLLPEDEDSEDSDADSSDAPPVVVNPPLVDSPVVAPPTIMMEPGPVIVQPAKQQGDTAESVFEKIVDEIANELGMEESAGFGLSEEVAEAEEVAEVAEDEIKKAVETAEDSPSQSDGQQLTPASHEVTLDLSKAQEEALDEFLEGVTCKDVDISYASLLECADIDGCNFCAGASDEDLAEGNLLLAYMNCDLRLCTEPDPEDGKPECTMVDLTKVDNCQKAAMGGKSSAFINDNPQACQIIAEADACIDNFEGCDACKFAEFYKNGYVEETNLKAIAENCPARMCGQEQGGLEWKSTATLSIAQKQEEPEGNGDVANSDDSDDDEDKTSILGVVVFTGSVISVALVFVITKRNRDLRELGRHTFLNDEDDASELEMQVGGAKGKKDLPKMEIEKGNEDKFMI